VILYQNATKLMVFYRKRKSVSGHL